MIEKNGAPERIRTSDPQIRRLGQSVEFLTLSDKPGLFEPVSHQWVSRWSANRPPDPGNETADLRGKEIGGKRRIGERGRSAQSGEYDNPIHIASVPPIIALHFFGFAAGGGAA